MMKKVKLPIATVSESNKREHWTVSHKRHKSQKFQTRIGLLEEHIPQKLPVKITLTRYSPRKLDDDNLRGALKYIRDAVAEHFITGKAPGRADDDPRMTWDYSQIKHSCKYVMVTFQWSDCDV